MPNIKRANSYSDGTIGITFAIYFVNHGDNIFFLECSGKLIDLCIEVRTMETYNVQ